MAPVNPAPDQLYVTPDNGPPCKVAVVVVHVITVAKLAVVDGRVVFVVTATVPSVAQPAAEAVYE